jgi:hypothetical protein
MMNKFWIATTTACLLTVSAMSQTSASSAPASGQMSTAANGPASSAAASTGASHGLLTGASILAEIAKTVDVKKAKSGDEITARLTQDLKMNGAIMIPKGSKLLGHVTEAQAKTKENAGSKLGVVFDKAVLKNGQEVAFTGVIRALSAPVDVPTTALGGGNMERSSFNGRGITPTPMGGAVSAPDSGSSIGAPGKTAPAAANGISNDSRGIIGMDGVELNNSVQASVFSSANHNIRLDSGAQIIVQVTGSQDAH